MARGVPVVPASYEDWGDPPPRSRVFVGIALAAVVALALWGSAPAAGSPVGKGAKADAPGDIVNGGGWIDLGPKPSLFNLAFRPPSAKVHFGFHLECDVVAATAGNDNNLTVHWEDELGKHKFKLTGVGHSECSDEDGDGELDTYQASVAGKCDDEDDPFVEVAATDEEPLPTGPAPDFIPSVVPQQEEDEEAEDGFAINVEAGDCALDVAEEIDGGNIDFHEH